MARKHSRRRKHGRAPSAKAKRAYYRNIEKSFVRLAKTVKKHNRNLYDHVCAD